MSARFEVVRSDAGFFARFVAANGRKVWQTEVYAKRIAAVRAVAQIAKPLVNNITPWPTGAMVQQHGAVEVRDVDERTQP